MEIGSIKVNTKTKEAEDSERIHIILVEREESRK
jgi:hypothetical protein